MPTSPPHTYSRSQWTLIELCENEAFLSRALHRAKAYAHSSSSFITWLEQELADCRGERTRREAMSQCSPSS